MFRVVTIKTTGEPNVLAGRHETRKDAEVAAGAFVASYNTLYRLGFADGLASVTVETEAVLGVMAR